MGSTPTRVDLFSASWNVDCFKDIRVIYMHAYIHTYIPMISEHATHLTPLPFGIRTWLWRYTCLLLISMLWHRQAIFESKGDKLSTSAYCRIQTQRRFSRTESPADWIPADKPTELSRIELKIRTRQPVPMISEHAAHSTPLLFGIHTWLWRYTCLLLLISILWHSQAILESRADKLFSSAECRILRASTLRPEWCGN